MSQNWIGIGIPHIEATPAFPHYRWTKESRVGRPRVLVLPKLASSTKRPNLKWLLNFVAVSQQNPSDF